MILNFPRASKKYKASDISNCLGSNSENNALLYDDAIYSYSSFLHWITQEVINSFKHIIGLTENSLAHFLYNVELRQRASRLHRFHGLVHVLPQLFFDCGPVCANLFV